MLPDLRPRVDGCSTASPRAARRPRARPRARRLPRRPAAGRRRHRGRRLRPDVPRRARARPRDLRGRRGARPRRRPRRGRRGARRACSRLRRAPGGARLAPRAPRSSAASRTRSTARSPPGPTASTRCCARRRTPVPRALVTGCAGFIGSHLTEALLADGHEVVGVDCFSDNYPAAEKLANLARVRATRALRAAPVDLASATSRACSTAATSSSTSPPSRACARAGGAASTASSTTTSRRRSGCSRRCASAPGTRLVYASSSSVYGESERLPTREDAPPRPLSPYGVTKLAGEQLCRVYHVNHGVDTVALRFFTVYGPRQRPDMAFRRFCEAAARGGRSSCSATAARAATSPTSPTSSTRSARPPRRRAPAAAPTTSAAARRSASTPRSSSWPRSPAARSTCAAPSRESGDVLHTAADIGRARAELGFAPVDDGSREGLRAEYEWVVERARAGPRARRGQGRLDAGELDPGGLISGT